MRVEREEKRREDRGVMKEMKESRKLCRRKRGKERMRESWNETVKER